MSKRKAARRLESFAGSARDRNAMRQVVKRDVLSMTRKAEIVAAFLPPRLR